MAGGVAVARKQNSSKGGQKIGRERNGVYVDHFKIETKYPLLRERCHDRCRLLILSVESLPLD